MVAVSGTPVRVMGDKRSQQVPMARMVESLSLSLSLSVCVCVCVCARLLCKCIPCLKPSLLLCSIVQ